MHIALIRQRYNPFGGAERFIERAMQALEREGTEVTLITRSWKKADKRSAVVVNPPYAGRLWRDASFSRAVRKVLVSKQFDLAQSHERIPGCDVYRAGDGVHRRWLEHRLTQASAVEQIGIRINPYHWYVCSAERLMFEHPGLRAVICNSKMVAEEISAAFSVAKEKLHVIYNGVDLTYFHPDQRKALRDAARSRLGCQEGDTLFSFVGSGFDRKGLGTAIDALKASGRPDFRLVVAGEDRALPRFAERARQGGVADRVTFMGGTEDVRSVYAASDCFILPTIYDPFPNAALEALAMGVPAIVSTQCGAAEIVSPGINGWVCEPHCKDSIAALMVDAADRAGDGMDASARRTAEAFGIEKMAGQMTDLYRRLLGHSAEPSVAD
jgi:UDP-glucose:(heptosyl)LPS alpha-1,3-glucosyltransferase